MFPNTQFDEKILKDSQEYAKSFQKYDFSDLIEFNDNFLAGSWDGIYGILIFEDGIKSYPLDPNNKLKSKVAIFNEIQKREALKMWNFPYLIQNEIIRPMLEQNRYFSNHDFIKDRSCGSFLTFTSDDVIPEECLDKSKWTEHLCSSSDLSPIQFMKVMTEIHNRRDRDDILNFYNDKVKKGIDSSYKESITLYQHLEMPYRLRLFGNDDSSYTKLFATEEEAFDCYNKMKELAKTKSSGYDVIKELGFLFSN